MKKIPFAWFYCGRCLRMHMDRELSFGIWPRKNPQEGEISHRISFTLIWNWPRLYWQYIKD